MSRQLNTSATTSATPGPSTPGSTHAVDSVANICGRSRSGSVRPIATNEIGGIAPPPRLFFFKQKTAYEIGLGIPAEPLFRSTLILNTFLFGVIILIANILKRAFSSQLAAKLRNRLLVL